MNEDTKMKTFDLRPYLLESDLLPVKVDSMIAALVDEGKDESASPTKVRCRGRCFIVRRRKKALKKNSWG